jgi:hypothetical protein
VQEFYESPNKKFRGKEFSMWDYMKWYSSEYKRGFSYGVDWSGFNIPFDTFEKCYKNMKKFETPYDGIMYKIYWQIQMLKKAGKAYIIGAGDMEGEIFEHEVCHGLWYTNAAYKKDAKLVLSTIPQEDKDIFKANLIEMGYTDKVIDDEIQAYLTTNWDYERFGKGVGLDKRKKYNQAFITIK